MNQGLLRYRPNEADAFAEAPGYYAVLTFDEQTGRWQPLLLTESELSRIRDRAQVNPEDCPRPTWLDRLLRSMGA